MKYLKKWDYQTKTYKDHKIPLEWNCPLSTQMDKIVNCANCGKEQIYGKCYTSLTIHTPHGLGYPVCESCYDVEAWYKTHNK